LLGGVEKITDKERRKWREAHQAMKPKMGVTSHRSLGRNRMGGKAEQVWGGIKKNAGNSLSNITGS